MTARDRPAEVFECLLGVQILLGNAVDARLRRRLNADMRRRA
ncbi:hypothetical protein [Nocardia sp.]|nr:hypothetical protein [Nocardia sp.]